MSNSIGSNGSLLVGLTMLAVGGLGLFIYKSSNESEEEVEDDDFEDNVSSSEEEESSSSEEEEEEEEEQKPPAKKTRAKTQRPKRATKGTKRQRY